MDNLNKQVTEIINNLEINTTELSNSDINLIANQVFNTLYQVNNNIEYTSVYSSVLIVINSIVKQNENKSIVDNFNHYRNQLDTFKSLKENAEQQTLSIEEMKNNLMREKVEHLKSLFQPEQRTTEWYEMRKTMFTASADVCDICNFNSKSKYSSNVNKVVLKKNGLGPKFTGNKYTEWGCKYEDIAIGIYEARYNKEIWEFGLIQHPTITCLGASPDGITTDGRMLEIKCPSGRKIDGKIKTPYAVQMQVQLEVCDLDVCDFFECNIEEYSNYQDYKDDVFIENEVDFLDIMPKRVDVNFITLPKDRRTAYGLEKGLIGTYVVDNGTKWGEKKWVYPPFTLDTKEQFKWLNVKQAEFKKKDISLYINYWKLELSSMNIVKRDRQWWKDNNITQRLYDAWVLVEDARKNGTDKYLSKKQYAAKYDTRKSMDMTDLFVEEPKKEEKMNECFILDSSDDEEEKPKKVIKKVKKVKKLVKKKVILKKKIKKVKKVKKLKKVKKQKEQEKLDGLDDDLISMMGNLMILDDD